MFEKVKLHTTTRQELIGITDTVKDIVQRSGVQEGMCYVYCPHSTAGLTINSPFDPNTWKDLTSELDRVVPTRVDFYHTTDTPSDAAAHVKSTLAGVDAAIIIHEGKLLLGWSQGLLFAEFDGPRDREYYVKVVAD
jgi:secondary thiamine-phosphate synthase enzyme